VLACQHASFVRDFFVASILSSGSSVASHTCTT
jgi:hypothetical protein